MSGAAFDSVSFLEQAVQTPLTSQSTRCASSSSKRSTSSGPKVRSSRAGACSRRSTRTRPAGPGPHLVLNTHLDTVTPHVPFERGEAHEDERADSVSDDGPGDVIRGRGACDAKGPLAALLSGFLAADPERGRITLALTPDEESLSLGAAALTGRSPGTEDRLNGDLFLVGEPTSLDACTAAKGRFQGTVELSGTAAHAAEFAGANAVAAAEGALAAIRTFDDGADEHPQLGPPKLTPTVIEGGGQRIRCPRTVRSPPIDGVSPGDSGGVPIVACGRRSGVDTEGHRRRGRADGPRVAVLRGVLDGPGPRTGGSGRERGPDRGRLDRNPGRPRRRCSSLRRGDGGVVLRARADGGVRPR